MKSIIDIEILCKSLIRVFEIVVVALLLFSSCNQNTSIRQGIPLNDTWKTTMHQTNQSEFTGFENAEYNDSNWQTVNVPHNWDSYEGYRRLKHGNLHGYAWYRKEFQINAQSDKKYFLWFEGVGSYATVWLNGKKVGTHAGGRTSFTLDVSETIKTNGENNMLAVRADHPSEIRDLPWVCGGCSDEWGFSEGSQPMGIFRPVHLIITNDVRVEPFGVQIWNDTTVNEKKALLNINVEVKNYSKTKKEIKIVNSLLNHKGRLVASISRFADLEGREMKKLIMNPMAVNNPKLWSLENPYLYTLKSEIFENGKLVDQTSTKYGIRWISWPIGRNSGSNQFLLNGKPVFINGTAEYEHNMGQSHAFSEKQIKARAMQVMAAGYNAFRDAHQPHNLRYQQYWEDNGLLWWPQMAAHIWFDNPEFKKNFKNLLADFVKERRNNPSVILWGLENESTLPTDFAEECTEIIRQLDPTTSSQRKVTTCNGGTGTDWNVIQNWSGTYAGDPDAYAIDISKQLLNGEYGAWRSIDLHTEGPFDQDGILSEDRMTLLMESKIRLAESVRDKCCGQFHWPFVSHENPGRIQNGEGLRDMDRLGPVNYKGLFTPWGEPTDAFYMFRSNYADKKKEPMVYIVSHTWPNRWTETGIKDSIIVYSNCDEVELFNESGDISFGKKRNPGIGNHFQWDEVNIQHNVLKAVGFVDRKKVAEDIIQLLHLPNDPVSNPLIKAADKEVINSTKNNYLYRVNCGGPDFTDQYGNVWIADVHLDSDSTWGSLSWTDDYENLPYFYGSQRRTFDPIAETYNDALFQTFRYGNKKLKYVFPVRDGDYQVDLLFVEPWYGTGGGLDCEDWRIFDVAINWKVFINDLDIWSEVGHDKAMAKSIISKVEGGKLVISFPEVLSGQAVISGIAISTPNNKIKPAFPSQGIISEFTNTVDWEHKYWLDIGNEQFSNQATEFSDLPSILFGSEWIQTFNKTYDDDNETLASFRLSSDADVFIAMDSLILNFSDWMNGFKDTKTYILTTKNGGTRLKLYGKRMSKGEVVKLKSPSLLNSEKPEMYSVFVVPVSDLVTAADQRESIRYEAEEALLSGNKTETLLSLKGIPEKNESRVYVKFQNLNEQITWKIYVGIADEYQIKIKYRNNTNNSIPMRMRIYSHDGILMTDQELDFISQGEKWKTLTTTTGATINAGNYNVVLNPLGKNGLCVDALDVQ